ncbi:TPA: IS110 family transposase [Vibrio parahaemolyticus]|uniref:IS110 family transposase n=1 Tax=Vibrio parahaemolyticus TaxID=670 RepID=UPI0004057525|nr:IS110 family transposase [Vibrio parahaemolyticus]EGQ7945944.1 IS110 family transposase [Vibrio parahaemolyticus]EHH2464397.1 IS110 family transposase [Vibrio parahaemolyticus]EHR6442187.1 IS110 family transposase [Vibrio parahaemolyticus]MBM4941498.1 IS110 family transposase [Vibrio parahaemolyticus]MCC3820272.1 IS110 family transposase [Vibrio parahaemolyticus]
MSDYSYFGGIDLAKNHFSIHVVNSQGKVILHKSVTRSKLLPTLANMPPMRIGFEACGGAHYWARTLHGLGHDARIMAVKYVVPHRTKGKNDLNDAVAICQAVQHSSTRFPVKSPEQQAILSVHRMRENWVRERTALMNRIRALLSEFGLIIPVGRSSLMKQVPLMLEDAENELPNLARTVIADAYHHLEALNQRIADTEQVFDAFAKVSDNVQRIMKVRGIGPQTATAILASIGNGTQFDKSRDFSAWLGLVPKQYSTGGKPRLGRITKHGDKYLRTLLVHGARTVMANLGDKQDRLSQWCRSILERRGMNRAIVALAAKNARIIWSLLHNQTEYENYAA